MASYHHTTLQTLKCSSNTRTSATSAEEQRTPRTAAAPWRPIWGERELKTREKDSKYIKYISRPLSIVPGTINSSIDGHDELINHSSNREKLQECLLAASKLCHVRFGGRMELATDSDECVLKLCYALESILQHGLRTKSIDKLNSALNNL
ncbi:hypothetical protein PV326_004599 [Microctonus aethiopoides]|nr:hypothetical protein PV326_004599 [Microctonus aethiopoides]